MGGGEGLNVRSADFDPYPQCEITVSGGHGSNIASFEQLFPLKYHVSGYDPLLFS